MASGAIPSISISTEQKLSIKIPSTNAVVTDQGYTYNQAGFTYNQLGVEYGGVTNPNADAVPTILNANKEQQMHLTASKTNAILNDQGYTYNQAGFSYNQLGVFYGGLTLTNQDVVPVFANIAKLIAPDIIRITDLYTPAPQPTQNAVMGVGWFMYVLHG